MMCYLCLKLIFATNIAHSALFLISTRIITLITSLILSQCARAFEGRRSDDIENLKNRYYTVEIWVIVDVCVNFYGRGGVGRWLLGRRRRPWSSLLFSIFGCELCFLGSLQLLDKIDSPFPEKHIYYWN